MFKFNETTVNFGFMDGFKDIKHMIKNMKTIEVVVLVIVIGFVMSKIFDMFRVKVEV